MFLYFWKIYKGLPFLFGQPLLNPTANKKFNRKQDYTPNRIFLRILAFPNPFFSCILFLVSRGILIAGNESSLLTALCVEAAKRVENYAVALIPREEAREMSGSSAGGRRIMVDWNPASPVSAKTVVLSCRNRLENIDDAVLVCVPPACRKRAEKMTAEEIDRFIDFNIKGWFFLVREIVGAFESRNQGNLSLVLAAELGPGSKEDQIDLVGPIAVSAFRSFAQGILLSSFNASYNAMGFSSSEAGEENAFAAYVFKIMEEDKKNSGKWHKHGKLSLFGR
jgi:NAD(P)-dependent dehydrogenase (short-subunit alcohol dehydrogenase family)